MSEDSLGLRNGEGAESAVSEETCCLCQGCAWNCVIFTSVDKLPPAQSVTSNGEGCPKNRAHAKDDKNAR